MVDDDVVDDVARCVLFVYLRLLYSDSTYVNGLDVVLVRYNGVIMAL